MLFLISIHKLTVDAESVLTCSYSTCQGQDCVLPCDSTVQQRMKPFTAFHVVCQMDGYLLYTEWGDMGSLLKRLPTRSSVIASD
jgi:hypothetical protein